ncbi:hypothetical protein JYG30_10185 [Fibrella sp. USSR17]
MSFTTPETLHTKTKRKPTNQQYQEVKWPLWVLLGAYALFTGFLMRRHEPCFDEIHAWVIVLHSESLNALHANKVYEGHPDAWYVILYAISQFTKDFFWVQIAHWAMIVGAMLLLVRYAPFSIVTKSLLLFSYLFAYEYAVISRNYALGILLLFVVCSLFRYRSRSPVYLSICLILMVLIQVSALTALVGCALYGALILDSILHNKAAIRANWLIYGVGLLLIVAGLAFCYLSVVPPADLNLYWIDTRLTVERFFRSATYFVNAFLQIPADPWYFWNTALLDNIQNGSLQLLVKCMVVLGIIGLVAVPMFRSRVALLGWTAACLAVFIMFYTRYPGIFRHHGHFFIAFVCFLWIQPQLIDYRKSITVSKKAGILFANRAWVLLLSLQVAMAFFAGYQDARRPFSMGKQVAAFILSQGYKDHFLAGYLDNIGESVAAFIPGFRMYYPSSGRQNNYLKNDSKVKFLTNRQLVDSVRKRTIGPVLLIVSGKMPYQEADSLNLIPVQHFVGSIVMDEQYMLYELRPEN